ncbi:diaminobutyrate acetyltransferase [Cohnella sp.]|uniref:diaminobutyrate acetyltransferase n=1 Tax=Cohnella sp. TaxID=1883426 RepID=UPI00356B1D00
MKLENVINVDTLRYRLPGKNDGASMWRMVKESGKLDLNSPYHYLTMSHWFSDSCRLAEDPHNNRLVGMVTGFRQPSHPETLFVWQIAVDDHYRGRGIARRLLDELTANRKIRYVEATISPSNLSSKRLFEKWAAARQASIVISEGFSETCFPGQQHEREDLYRIGPLRQGTEWTIEEE